MLVAGGNNDVSGAIVAGLAGLIGQPAEVSWASSGEEGREILGSGSIDVLIVGKRLGGDVTRLRNWAAQDEQLAIVLLNDGTATDWVEALSLLFVQVVS